MKIGLAGPIALGDVERFLSPGQVLNGREMKGSSLLISLIEELLGMGYEVSVYSTEQSLELKKGVVDVLTGPRFRLIRVPLRRSGVRSDRGVRGRILDLFLFERRALKRVIVEDAPDVVHSHWSYEFSWAALDSGRPSLITCHDAPLRILRLDPSLYRVGRLLMAYKVLKRASSLTAVSPYLLPELSFFTRKHVEVIPNPIPRAVLKTGGYRTFPERRSGRLRVVMIINGWSVWKNAECGMKALVELKNNLNDVDLMLIGPDFGPGERAEKWARSVGLEKNFLFAGAMRYNEVQSSLSDADLLVHPALEESFGMTIAEAMALGIPVVAGASSGAVPWVTGDGAAGLLVDIRSPREIATAAQRLLQDTTLYAKCSLSGFNRAKEIFSAQAVTNRYVEKYREIIGSSESTAHADRVKMC